MKLSQINFGVAGLASAIGVIMGGKFIYGNIMSSNRDEFKIVMVLLFISMTILANTYFNPLIAGIELSA
jgi:hypothetical protein